MQNKQANKVSLFKNIDTKKDIELSPKSRLFNNLIVGKTCSGKSVYLEKLVKKDLEVSELGIIVVDTTEQLIKNIENLAKKNNREISVLNQNDVKSKSFNPLIGETKDVIEIMTKSLQSMQKEKLNEISVELIKNSINILKTIYNNELNMEDFFNFINKTKTKENLTKFSNLKNIQEKDNIVIFINDYLNNEETFNKSISLRENVSNLLENQSIKELLTSKEKELLTISEYMNEGKVLLISTGFNSNGFLEEAIVSTLTKSIASKKKESLIHIYLDEGNLLINESFINLSLVAKAFNVGLHASVMNLMFLEEDIGDKQFDSFINNFRNLIILKSLYSEDRQFLSERFPNFKKEIMSEEHNYSRIVYSIISKEGNLVNGIGRLH